MWRKMCEQDQIIDGVNVQTLSGIILPKSTGVKPTTLKAKGFYYTTNKIKHNLYVISRIMA